MLPSNPEKTIRSPTATSCAGETYFSRQKFPPTPSAMARTRLRSTITSAANLPSVTSSTSESPG